MWMESQTKPTLHDDQQRPERRMSYTYQAVLFRGVLVKKEYEVKEVFVGCAKHDKPAHITKVEYKDTSGNRFCGQCGSTLYEKQSNLIGQEHIIYNEEKGQDEIDGIRVIDSEGRDYLAVGYALAEVEPRYGEYEKIEPKAEAALIFITDLAGKLKEKGFTVIDHGEFLLSTSY